MPQDRVLVTGASGFIAKHCIAALIDDGYRVRATVRSPDRAAEVEAAVAHARGNRPLPDSTAIEFIQADLMNDQGWDAAVDGCRFVQHVASPFPIVDPKDRQSLIGPARDGSLRVLKAAHAAGVERVVLTSSMAAICYVSGPAPGRKMTEDDWTDVGRRGLTAYLASKTVAERAAWDWMADRDSAMTLTTINPGLVLGPALDARLSSSLDVIRINLSGAYPALPRVSYPITDVRDVARLHVIAMTHPAASGERFISASDTLSVADVMRVVADTLPDLARKVPRLQAPDLVIRGLALFDRSARSLIPDLGRWNELDNTKARRTLGYEFRSAEEAVRSAALSMRILELI